MMTEVYAITLFSHYGPSTVRKRRSELFQDGKVEKTGELRDRMNVWKAVA